MSYSALFLVLFCFLVSEHVSPAAGVRIEPSGKTKYKKESANLYLECLLDPGEEMEGQCSRFMSMVIAKCLQGDNKVIVRELQSDCTPVKWLIKGNCKMVTELRQGDCKVDGG